MGNVFQILMENTAPGKPQSVEVTASSILLSWEPPSSGTEFQQYEIKYRATNENSWNSISTKGKKIDFAFTDLKSNSGYVFRVRTVFESGDEGPFSEISDVITTQKSPVDLIKQQAILLTHGTPQTYQLPVRKEYGTDISSRTRKCIILDEKPDPLRMQKTIMVIGPTGSGKSTLIEGMLNYILGVSWEDDTRFKLIDLKNEEKTKQQNQVVSQTDWITCYSLNWTKGFQVDFNINIIDTPGFGDTRGIIRDQQLVDQIRTFFTSSGDRGIDELNAVCFIVKSTEVRLTQTMRYIFDQILSLFGRDIEKHIHVLMTFADGEQPLALNALKAARVPFQKAFVFNNSALFLDPAKSQHGRLFWNMGKISFENFFLALGSMEARSLRMTSTVLRKRRQLEVDIANIQRQIREGTDNLAVIHQEELILDKYKAQVAANKNFKTTIKKPCIYQLALAAGIHTTTCLTCNRTCHADCGFPDDAEKKFCWAMTNDYCRECPKQCIWSMHKSLPYHYVSKIVEETVTLEHIKAKYNEAEGEAGKKTSLIDRIKQAFNDLREKNLLFVERVRECIAQLDKIALRGNPLSSVDYIEILMKAESDEKKPGYKQRLDMLAEMKARAMTTKDIIKDKYNFPKIEKKKSK